MSMPTDQVPCPYCSALCDADWVDVEVGWVQSGPYHCVVCGASEIGSYDEERVLDEREKKTGWYAPGSSPGSSANVINGKVVSANEMNAAYQAKFRHNPEWEDELYVKKWLEDLRNPSP